MHGSCPVLIPVQPDPQVFCNEIAGEHALFLTCNYI